MFLQVPLCVSTTGKNGFTYIYIYIYIIYIYVCVSTSGKKAFTCAIICFY